MKQYRARQAIRTKRDGKTLPPGSLVDLDLTTEEEAKLIKQGLIEPVLSTSIVPPRAEIPPTTGGGSFNPNAPIEQMGG